MRTRVLALAAVALVAAACGSSASSQGYGGPTAPPEHHTNPDPYPPDPGRPAASAYGGVTYQDPGVNPREDPDEDQVSTFGLDVDTASYAIAQRYVADGNRPDPASVRVEEWVNAFQQDYPTPGDETFGIVTDGGPTPFAGQDEVLLRVGIQARDVRSRAREDAHLTFVIDTSGSMAREERLELVKDALRTLVGGLDQADTVAIVTFGSDARVVLEPTRATDDRPILEAIDDLRPDGSTNLEAGLALGYELARETLSENGIDRVVLASDGVANVGLTDPGSILGRIRDDASAGIELVSVGVGMGNYNDVLLEQLADQGDGFYAYVNGAEEIDRLFRDDLVGTLQTVALDARAQVEFDPERVAGYRLLGYENRDISDSDFRDPGVAAGAIGAGHSVTALYAVRLRGDTGPDDRLATVRLRWTDPDRGGPREITRPVSAGDLAETFDRADPHLQFDAVVAATAEVLRDSPYAGRYGLADIRDIVERDGLRLPRTDEVHDFLQLLDELAAQEP